jgi:hypothetical protein
MSKCCEEYEDILIDIYYSELEISIGIKAHLENCSNCREFLNEMEGLRADLNHLEMDLSVDYSLIRNAFVFADEKAAKKRKSFDLFIFLSIAFGIMAFIFILALKGYEKYLLYGQGLIFFLAPFSLLAFVRGRRLKEDM